MSETRWYVVSKNGSAELCINERDTIDLASVYDRDFPNSAPHIAMQLVDAADVERLKALLTRVHADLLMRAAEDENGKLVVNLSRSIWEQLKEALK